MKNDIRDFIKSIQDENMHLAADALSGAEFTGYLDTGSYMFNAAMSGSLFGGLPNTKNLMLAGAEAVGKTFFAISAMKTFLDKDPDAWAFWYYGELAVPTQMFEDRNVDTNRVMTFEPTTILEWRHEVIRVCDKYIESKSTRPIMMVLDSLGALSTEKEVSDSTAGETTKDMTRQQHIRGTFRVIANKIARAKCPIIVINHIYDNTSGYGPKKIIAGGGGPKYNADIIAMLTASKKKENADAKEVTGSLIDIVMSKNRFAKPFAEVEVLLDFEKGLHRHYGLLDLGEKYGLFKKVSTKYEFPDGSKHFAKAVYKQPERFFTSDIMEKLDGFARLEYEYGKHGDTTNVTEDDRTDATPQSAA